MKKILVNAYAVSPDKGSEPGMGWNWCVRLAETYELYIITEGEFRDRIEAALPALPQGRNMHFHYLPLSDRIRRMCWNQGDWRFYWYYRKWQKRALALARDICARERIDVIHQLNMVGFREPGFLWKIPRIPYIWGPIGGMSRTPVAFFRDLPASVQVKLQVKNVLNSLQMNTSPRVYKAVARSSAVLCATEDERAFLQKKFPDKPLFVIAETGIDRTEILSRTPFMDGRFHILWVGRFIPSKQLGLALRILSRLPQLDIVLDVLGTGNEKENAAFRALSDKLGVSDRVVWHGSVPQPEVIRWMRSCDLFLFTSVREVTSTVITEAISAGLPIICFDTCGFGPIVDGRIGRKVPCNDPDEAERDFAAVISHLVANPSELEAMSGGGREHLLHLTWAYKMQQLKKIYEL